MYMYIKCLLHFRIQYNNLYADGSEFLRLTHFERDFSTARNLNMIYHYGISSLASDLDLGLDFLFTYFFSHETIIEPLKVWLNCQSLSYREIYHRLMVERV